MTIQELEHTYIEDLNMLGDWILQYEYLLQISADLPRIPIKERTGERKVKSCQSGVWLDLSYDDGKINVAADSDAMIIRGMLSVIVSLLNGRTPEEIAGYEPQFISGTAIGRQISTDRFKGIHAVIKTIQDFAEQFGKKRENCPKAKF